MANAIFILPEFRCLASVTGTAPTPMPIRCVQKVAQMLRSISFFTVGAGVIFGIGKAVGFESVRDVGLDIVR